MAGGAQENLTGGETDQQMLSVIQGVMGQLMGGGGNSTTIGEFLNTLAQLCGGEEPEDQPNDLPGHGEHCGKQPHPCHHGRVLFLSMHCSDLERMFQMEGDGGGDIEICWEVVHANIVVLDFLFYIILPCCSFKNMSRAFI